MSRIITHADGRQIHVGGRRRAVARGPRLTLSRYLDLTGQAPAPDVDYTTNAIGLKDALGNDHLGDCTCAGIGHLIEIITAGAGTPMQVTAAQVIALYEAACGYQNGNAATDQGGDELTVLDYMAERGLDGKGLHQFVGSVLVNATDREEVRWALANAGNLYFGEEMPDAFVSPFPSDGGVWDVAGPPNPNNGHCFIGMASDGRGIYVNTWGLRVLHTYEAIAKYAASVGGGELHCVLTREWINATTQKTPAGLDFDALRADLAAIGGLSS